jgi:hypothetical protein
MRNSRAKFGGTIIMLRVIIFSIILVTEFQPECIAQPLRQFGFKLGISLANQQFQEIDFAKPTTRQTGFDAAVFTEWQCSSFISLVTQLELVELGSIVHVSDLAEFDHGPPSSATDVHNRLQYLSVVILGKFSLGKQSAVPYILIGPRADNLLAYSSDYHLLDDVYRQFKRFTFGASTGVGIDSGSLLSFTLIAEARYNFDFGNSYTFSSSTIRKDAIDLWIGVAF